MRFMRTALVLLALATAWAFVFAPPVIAADTAPVAIKGYDPVAYFTIGQPTPGRNEIEYEWDEQRYRFATTRNRALFKADPARYAPQFASFCAMSLTRGELVEANPEYWLIADGKLFLFGKQAGPSLFSQNLAENVARANGNRALPQPK